MSVTPPGTDPPGGAGGPDGEHAEPGGGGTGGEGPSAPEPGGWLPPENRVWRHPSELYGVGASGSRPDGGPAGRPLTPSVAPSVAAEHVRRHRRRLYTMGVVGTCGMLAAVGGAFLLASSGTGSLQVTGVVSPAPATTNLTSITSQPDVRVMADRRALVTIRAVTGAGITEECGVAVGPGGLVVAPYFPLQGASSIGVLTGTGRWKPAATVGVDPVSDLALLRVPETLPLPRFSDDTTLAAGAPADVVTEAYVHAAGRHDPGGGPATVQSVGDAASGTAAHGLATIVAAAPSVTPVPGSLLVAPDGSVLGLMVQPAGHGNDVFLPVPLVLGVASDLQSTGAVHHGWLDVDLSSAPGHPANSAGPLVSEVDPAGPAARRLRTGDEINQVAGLPVRSVADVQTQLYVLAPGTPVTLTVRRGGRDVTVTVDLASAP